MTTNYRSICKVLLFIVHGAQVRWSRSSMVPAILLIVSLLFPSISSGSNRNLVGTSNEMLFQALELYYDGSYHESFKLFHLLSDQGVAQATYNLAQMHRLGIPDPPDLTESYRLYLKSIEQGSPRGHLNIAVMMLDDSLASAMALPSGHFTFEGRWHLNEAAIYDVPGAKDLLNKMRGKEKIVYDNEV
jgi:TPR repeat protein